MKRIFAVCGLMLALLILCPVGGTAADAPAPTVREQMLDTLATRLIDAPDDATRRTLLAGAEGQFQYEEIRFAFHDKIGPILYAGDFPRVESLSRFEQIWTQENHDERGGMLVKWTLANMNGMRGNNQAALKGLEECVKFFTDRGEKERVASASTGLSIVHLQLGDYRRALEGFRRAHATYRELGNKEGIVNTLNSMGCVYNDQSLHDHAADMWQQALALAGEDPSWQTILLNNLATVYSARDEDDKAIDHVRRALALAEKVGEKPRIAISHDALGDLMYKANRWDEAETQYKIALKIAQELDDKRRRFSTTAALAAVAWQRGREHWDEALTLATQASALALETGEPAFRWEADTLLGKIQRARGETSRARTALEAAIACIEDVRGRLSGGDEGATVFLDDKVGPYQEMVALLADAGQTRDALAMAERAKARVLLEVLYSARLGSQAAMSERENERLKALGQEITDLNQQIARADDSAKELPGLKERLRQARLERERAEADVIAAHPQLRNRSVPDAAAALSPGTLAKLSDGGKTALLEYAVAETETFLFVVRGNQRDGSSDAKASSNPGVQVFRLPLGREALLARTRDFRRTLAERDLDWHTAARKLGADLLEASRPAWDGAERLVIVPDGVLWELPFQALAVGPKPSASAPEPTLLERLPVSFAPSLAFLACEAGDTKGAAHSLTGGSARLLALGAPALGKEVVADSADTGPVLMSDEIRPLPEADRQLRALGELYGRDHSRIFRGAEASEDTFKRLAGEFDILHFATHGFFNDGAPLYSRLLLNQRDLAADEDGFLEAWELLGLNLHARLAVLSACETGRGHISAGEGVFGLSWALLMAGCPEVVVSQWKVDSASTTELMVGLHRRLRAGKSPAASLREASLELMKNPTFRHPFYWAPFVAVGTAEG